MSPVVGYKAGSEDELPHVVKIMFRDTGVRDITRSDLIARWIEFWCQVHCERRWRVTEYQSHVDVHFEDETDLVYFKLSPEFDLN